MVPKKNKRMCEREREEKAKSKTKYLDNTPQGHSRHNPLYKEYKLISLVPNLCSISIIKSRKFRKYLFFLCNIREKL